MKEIKFSTNYEQILSFDDRDFKIKYEERISKNKDFVQVIKGETKHLAICPRCDNPVAILGIYKRIDTSPHARHIKGVNIKGVSEYNEYKYLCCPYHKKKADYIKEYVDETEEPERKRLYQIAKDNFDKAIYLIGKTLGLYVSEHLAEDLAHNYARLRVYNYIDATIYNIPWYMIYGYQGISLYHMLIRKNGVLYKRLKKLGIKFNRGNSRDYEYIENKEYSVTVTNYRYSIDKDDNYNEWIDVSITVPDNNNAMLGTSVDRFSIKVDSYYFGNLIEYDAWESNKRLLDIAERYMNP